MAASSDSTPNRGPTEKTNDLSAHSHRKIVSRVRPAGNGFTARNAELTEYGAASFVPGEALTYAYTKSITAPFEGLATAYTRSITAPFEGLAAAYAQSIVAPFEGVMSLPDQLGATVSRGLPANVDEMLGNVAKFGHQFDGLGTTPIANLAASMNLGHQFDHLGDLTESWTVSSAHVQNLFPDSPPIESLLSAVAPAVLEPPRAVPLGPTGAQYQLQATYELHAEVRAQRQVVESTNTLLQDVKSEFLGQRQDTKAQRKFKIARLAVDIVLVVCAVTSLMIAILR